MTENVSLSVVDFHGDKLQAVERDGRVLAAIRPLCEALGMNMATQLRKLHGKAWAVVVMMTTTGSDGKRYEMACLDVDSIPMWLAGIEPSKVSERVRPKLVLFQLEAHRVLRDHFVPRKRPGEPESHSVRLRDDARLKREMRAFCAMAGRAAGYTLAEVYGHVRRTHRVGSPFDVAVRDWPMVRDTLQAIALGQLFLPGRRKRLGADNRQVPFSWGTN